MIPEIDILKIEKRNLEDYITKLEEANKALQVENVTYKEQIENYIPRRRVRRVYKQLRTILEEGLEDENKVYIDKLKVFIQKIEKEGPQTAGQEIKQAIEHLLSLYVPVDSDITTVNLYAGGEIFKSIKTKKE